MKPLLVITLLIIIVVIGLISSSNIYLSNAQNGTQVSGIINQDTIWTKANSPYTLTGNVLVNSGATLTIEAGVRINLYSYYIMVNGTLIAKANSLEQIIFQSHNAIGIIFTSSSTAWNEQTKLGSIIDNAFFNSTSLLIDDSSPLVSNCLFYYPSTITIEAGSPTISNNSIRGVSLIVNGGSPKIVGNDISGSSKNGVDEVWQTALIINNGSPIVSNNSLESAEVGVQIEQGNAYVSDNSFKDCITGIFANTGTIEKNYIFHTTYGIKAGNATIQNNTVSSIYVEGASFPKIIYNNIDIGLHLSSSQNVNATYNWWGTTNTSLIEQEIYDYYDNFILGKVEFIPFLIEPNPQALPNPNATLPIAIPSATPAVISPTPVQSELPSQSPRSSPSIVQSPNSTSAAQLGLNSADIAIFTALISILILIATAVISIYRRRC